MAGAFNFPIIAPPIAKRGESVRIILGTIPASPLPPNPGCETFEIAVIDPSGRILPQQIVVKAAIGSVTYSAHYYFDFIFPSVGTFTIFAKVTTPPTPDVYIGVGVIHVPAWLDNIDTKISDVNKQSTEISRLRTSVSRTVTGA